MKMCAFPGCERLDGHPSTVPHATFDPGTRRWIALPEQRTPAQRMRERRERLTREKAERIADTVTADYGLKNHETARGSVREWLIAAATAAITETEKTR